MNAGSKKYLIIISVISAFLFIARILYVVFYDIDLHTEEAQYWLWSKHLSLSYYSKPPLIAWVNHLSTSLLGDTELGIRINAMIIGFVLPFLLYFITKQLTGNSRAGLISVMVLIGMPFYHYVSIFFTTDSLLMLFWLLTLISAWYAIKNNKWIYWIMAGLFLGLGFLSKYTMILFVPFLILYLYIYKRELLKQPGIYISLLIAFIFALPVIMWNLQNEFYGIKHILGLSGVKKEGIGIEAIVLNIGEYVGGQIMILSPFFIILIFRSFTRKIFMLNKYHSDALKYLKLSVIVVWLFFFPVAAKKIEINWLLFAYPAIPIIMSITLLQYKKFGKTLAPSFLSMIFIVLFLVPVIFDKIHGRSLYPPKVDTFYRMSGWEELGNKISRSIQKSDPEKTFVFSDSYHIASELSFYIEDNPQTYVINQGRRMNQFDLWKGIEQFENKEYKAIYVSGKPAPEELQKSFDELKSHRTYERSYRGVKVKTIHIYVFQNLLSYEPTKPTSY